MRMFIHMHNRRYDSKTVFISSPHFILDKVPHFKATKNAVDMAWEKALKDPSVYSYLSDQWVKWSLIIELSRWIGGFYKRFAWTAKMALRKSIGRVSLTSFQLQTILTEVEAVTNNTPLIYANNDQDNQIITTAHFLSINIKTITPVLTVNAVRCAI